MHGQENCLVVVGEKSGEEHALSFIPGLIQKMPELHLWGIGGDELKDIGMEVFQDYKSFASFGVSGVLNQIPAYYFLMQQILGKVKEKGCRYAILVDFQTFNLILAQKLKKMGVKVFYYVAPQAWAWKSYRVKNIKRDIEALFCILPFEKKWFGQYGVSNLYHVDHPLLHKINFLPEPIKKEGNCLNVLLLPGSRKSEFFLMMPLFIQVAKELKKWVKDIKIVLVLAKSLDASLVDPYRNYIDKIENSDDILKILPQVDFALASSGTVTLLTGIYQVPTIVCYKVSLFNQFIFESFINYKGAVSLTNLILDEMVFPEFLQGRANAFNILRIISEWIDQPEKLKILKDKLAGLKKLLQGDGVCPEDIIIQAIKAS